LKKGKFIHIKLVTSDTGFVNLFEISAFISSSDSENCKLKFPVGLSIVFMQFSTSKLEHCLATVDSLCVMVHCPRQP